MKNEIKIFFTALMFYSRIPAPKWVGYSSDNLNKATRYFPLVGIIVGGVGALIFYAAHLVFSVPLAIICSLIAMIVLTGAFHEDAISDFCDGFGGGYGKDKILAIMKDSRIGTYGAVALVMLLLSKVFLLSEINVQQIPFVILAAHALSRVNPVLLIFTSSYVRDDDSGKSKPVGQKHAAVTLYVAIIIGLLPMVFIEPLIILVVLGVLSCIFVYFRYYVHKVIGGYTGDVLGALQQFSEVGFYISYIAAAKLL